MAFDFLNSNLREQMEKVSAKWKRTGPWRIPSVAYTMIHKGAFMECEHYLTGRYSFRGLLHDWEKPLAYLIPGLTDSKIQQFHCNFHGHHIEGPSTNKVDHLIEAYLDWNSSAITKPDKPLDPYATLIHFYPKSIDLMLPVCLACNPNRVTPVVSDLDEGRKKGNDKYVFLTEERGLEIFNRVKKTIREIAAGVAARNPNDGLTADEFPHNLKDMNSTEIFLKTLAVLAQMRDETVDVSKMQETIANIQTSFETSNQFDVMPLNDFKELNPIEHSFLEKMKHPFIVERTFQCGVDNQRGCSVIDKIRHSFVVQKSYQCGVDNQRQQKMIQQSIRGENQHD